MAYRVLIADDSPVMRSFVRRVIELSGFELSDCFEVNNGDEALALLRTEWVDAILTDINMPVVDGEEFVRRRAAEDRIPSVPAIVVGCEDSDRHHHPVRRRRALGQMTKPCRSPAMHAEFGRLLGVRCA